ncbi:MAG: bifunctional (p)ppGpp synthetase/guanosine-3',5'-bis(diphosphate) 3'-pyrophosphohydrolase [Deltaproteobacteria bacterium]|nr:bifunctional (p)ppGpp synthetase/guanosine-3',5'-bis(diphosphate) 3'-pyrophosphohydrolase [Deltaproteobacteria bacterium]
MSTENKTKINSDDALLEQVQEVITGLLKYHPQAPQDLILKAFQFSKEAHKGQKRVGGEDYITHPIAVTRILVNMKMDIPTILTGLLHDTVEDTLVTVHQIEKEFGDEVAKLVDGVTKLAKLKFKTSEEKQAENFRKMFIAMAQDIRVIIVKLADRLHNMRTLIHMEDHRQQRIAQETLDIYAPLANRLGISWLKIEMEDLCLRYLKPDIYYRLVQNIAKKKEEREKYIEGVVSLIHKHLVKNNIKASVKGRPKHFYSIYKKMEQQNLSFDQVFDILGFRIIVDSIGTCYETLGLIHSMWKPVPGRFKDYIAMPKANSYQSLHTTLIGPHGERVEIQIRTKEMDLIAEKGIAAHWQYKEGHMDHDDVEKFTWLRQLIEYQKELKDPTEFLDTVKIDLFPAEIYIFTPKGRVIELPQGSTPVDFAYAIHTEVGEHCVGARVNGKIVPLRRKLESGDTVEVMTDPQRHPSKDWLQFVQTSKAKTKIRKFIKEEQRQRGLQLGEELCEKSFRKYSLEFKKLFMKGELEPVAKEMNYKKVEDLIAAVGYGLIGAEHIAKRFLEQEVTPQEKKESFIKQVHPIVSKGEKPTSESAIQVRGLDDILVRFALCCTPLKGDPIIGFVTRGRGVTVHRTSCPKMLSADPARKIGVNWESESHIERNVQIKVVCLDVKGLLVEMSQVFTDCGVNIVQAQIRTTRDKKAINVFTVQLATTEQLRKVMRAMEAVDGVISVERVS